GDRTFADQVGGTVDQVAALLHELVDLLAAGAGGLLQRGQSGDRAVGQVGLQVGLAQAHLFASGGGGAADGIGGVHGGLLQVAAGFGQVGLQVVGMGGAHHGLLGLGGGHSINRV